MLIIEDKGQQAGKHEMKHRWFDWHEVELLQAPLPVGDYVLADDKVLDVIQRKTRRNLELKKMDFLGSYKIAVDTKRDMQEITGNICGKQHPRFRDECILAQNNGIKLYVLIENTDQITCLSDVVRWKNPRIARYEKIKRMHSIGKWRNVKLPKSTPTSGEILMKAMQTMQEKYGVKFLFCHPEEAGAHIIRLLTYQEG